jgi:serine/threonine-protein kinase
MAGHLTKNPDRIRRQRPDVPPGLEAVVLKAMRRYPEHRYQSAAALLDDLDRLDTLDVATFDLSPEEPMGGMAAVASQKRMVFLVAAIAIAVVAVFGIIFVLVDVVG